jgi:hypothetical protein
MRLSFESWLARQLKVSADSWVWQNCVVSVALLQAQCTGKIVTPEVVTIGMKIVQLYFTSW